jgi:hypothetical protein
VDEIGCGRISVDVVNSSAPGVSAVRQAEVTIQFLLVVGNLAGIVLILVISLVQQLSLTLAGFVCVLVLLAPTIVWQSYSGQHRRFDSEVQQQRLADMHVGFTPAQDEQGKIASYQSTDAELNARL